jgi:hypothetical protein
LEVVAQKKKKNGAARGRILKEAMRWFWTFDPRFPSLNLKNLYNYA